MDAFFILGREDIISFYCCFVFVFKFANFVELKGNS